MNKCNMCDKAACETCEHAEYEMDGREYDIIKFINLRDSDVEYNFALFNIRAHKFVSINGRVAWYSFEDLEDSIRTECARLCTDPVPVIRWYANACPDRLFEGYVNRYA